MVGEGARVPASDARASREARVGVAGEGGIMTDGDDDVSRAIDSKKKVSTFVIDCAKPVRIKP